MAVAQLTTARAEQVKLANSVHPELNKLLPLLMSGDREGWLRAVIALLLPFRHESRRMSAQTYNLVRMDVIGSPLDTRPSRPDQFPERLIRSLNYLGPTRMSRMSRQAEQAGITLSERKVSRELLGGIQSAARKAVMDAGRDETFNRIVADPVAIGWARIVRPNACAFCAMLASRGFVYESDTVLKTKTGDDFHQGCRCIAAPQFTQNQPLPSLNTDLSNLWAETTKGLSGKEALSAFRQARGTH